MPREIKVFGYTGSSAMTVPGQRVFKDTLNFDHKDEVWRLYDAPHEIVYRGGQDD